jgi:hypothetical protein
MGRAYLGREGGRLGQGDDIRDSGLEWATDEHLEEKEAPESERAVVIVSLLHC